MPLDRRLSVAPMMDCTDRHARNFLRLFSKRIHLYTEMVTAPALLHGPAAELLAYSPEEHPVALQLGGSNPAELEACARMGDQAGYDEINLNVGCPSDRVRSGRFGACLMAEPRLVADCVSAMRAGTSKPVTVKSRIGIDGRESLDELLHFVSTVHAAGCGFFTLHARIAILGGLSPKQNRSIPPLKYDTVYEVKRSFPNLAIEINGGIKSAGECSAHLLRVDSVMVGREAYENPAVLLAMDREVFGTSHACISRHDLVKAWLPYVEARLAEGVPLHKMSRHLDGLFKGLPGARLWRQMLSDLPRQATAGVSSLLAAIEKIPETT